MVVVVVMTDNSFVLLPPGEEGSIGVLCGNGGGGDSGGGVKRRRGYGKGTKKTVGIEEYNKLKRFYFAHQGCQQSRQQGGVSFPKKEKDSWKFGSIKLKLDEEEEKGGVSGDGTRSAKLLFRDVCGRPCKRVLSLKVGSEDLTALKEDRHCKLKDVLYTLDNAQYGVREDDACCEFTPL